MSHQMEPSSAERSIQLEGLRKQAMRQKRREAASGGGELGDESDLDSQPYYISTVIFRAFNIIYQIIYKLLF